MTQPGPRGGGAARRLGQALLLAAALVSGPGAASSTRSTEAQLCAARYVVMARVENRETLFDPQNQSGNGVYSKLTLRTELNIHGDLPRSFVMNVEGGRWEGYLITVSGQPKGTPGARYLLFLGPSELPPVDSAPYATLRTWYGVHTELQLPTEAEAQALWKEHCSPEPGADQPTLKYLPFLAPEHLALCQHY